MKGSDSPSPLDISAERLLTREQRRLCRAAIAAGHEHQSAFASDHDLHPGMLSEVLNRERRPSARYATVLRALLRTYLKRIRFTLSRTTDL